MGFRLKESESVSEGIQRIAHDLVDSAIDHLNLKTRNKDRAVHDARVSFKKMRALLRLVYGELGRDIFKLENREYRDAGRRLAATRDTAVVALTLEELVHQFDKQLADPDIKTLRKRLRRSRAVQQTDRKQTLLQVAESLSAAKERVETWPINHDGFPALRDGLKRIYKRGRDGFMLSRAERTTENLHEWRKQVKYLWYQVSILNPMWPKPMDMLARELNKLADYLSEDHDLALLTRTAIEQAPSLSAPDELEKLILFIDQRRIQLQAKAVVLGARIYGEKPKSFVNRMESYWEAWRPAAAVETVEDSQMELAFEAASNSPV
jgi:CHAD domain-containing protein